MQLNVNGKVVEVDVEPDMPLLWVLRDELKLKGLKYGCGITQCGACTIHLNGVATRSCVLPVGAVTGNVTTIDSEQNTEEVEALKDAWIKNQVPQCGYCQSGQIMQAASLLSTNRNPSDEEIRQGMSGNLCRCGTYLPHSRRY